MDKPNATNSVPAWLKPGMWVKYKTAPYWGPCFITGIEDNGTVHYHLAYPWQQHAAIAAWQTGGKMIAYNNEWEPCDAPNGTRSETRRQDEGYSGIAHDFETMRAALEEIRKHTIGQFAFRNPDGSVATKVDRLAFAEKIARDALAATSIVSSAKQSVNQSDAAPSAERFSGLVARLREADTKRAECTAHEGPHTILGEAADAIVHLSAASSARVPSGWKLVPVEPDAAMVDAGDLFFTNASFVNVSPAQIKRIYGDMLGASPEAPSVASATRRTPDAEAARNPPSTSTPGKS